MTARILPGGALAAAAYYAERLDTPGRVSLERAGELHRVSKQAVSAALRDPGRFARTRPAGRPTRAGAPTEAIPVRVGRRRARLRLTAEEREAFGSAAAGSIAEWLRGLLAEHPAPRGVAIGPHLRAIGRRAAGMAEE